MTPDSPSERNEPNLWANRGADLAWDAFRYVSDAMTPLEIDDFEERLFHDQAAREAVADAVDSLGATQIVAREVSVNRPVLASVGINHRRSRIGAPLVSMAMAAAVLLAACWGSGSIFRPASIGDAIDVALAWTHLRSDSVGLDASPPFADSTLNEPVGATESPTIDGGFAEVADVPAERPLPSWMVAAVSPNPDADADRPEDN